MTKAEFLKTYELMIVAEYPWAQDAERLARFMDSVRRTITSEAATWNKDSPVVNRAWRAIGGKGNPTYKALRALQAD